MFNDGNNNKKPNSNPILKSKSPIEDATRKLKMPYYDSMNKTLVTGLLSNYFISDAHRDVIEKISMIGISSNRDWYTRLNSRSTMSFSRQYQLEKDIIKISSRSIQSFIKNNRSVDYLIENNEILFNEEIMNPINKAYEQVDKILNFQPNLKKESEKLSKKVLAHNDGDSAIALRFEPPGDDNPVSKELSDKLSDVFDQSIKSISLEAATKAAETDEFQKLIKNKYLSLFNEKNGKLSKEDIEEIVNEVTNAIIYGLNDTSSIAKNGINSSQDESNGKSTFFEAVIVAIVFIIIQSTLYAGSADTDGFFDNMDRHLSPPVNHTDLLELKEGYLEKFEDLEIEIENSQLSLERIEGELLNHDLKVNYQRSKPSSVDSGLPAGFVLYKVEDSSLAYSNSDKENSQEFNLYRGELVLVKKESLDSAWQEIIIPRIDSDNLLYVEAGSLIKTDIKSNDDTPVI